MKKFIKIRAINLRKKGISYKEIARTLKISKSTSYLWLKNIKLTKKNEERLKFLQRRGRLKGLKKIRIKRNKLNDEIKKSAAQVLLRLNLDINIKKLLSAFLYWGEGEKSKNTLAFTNSDPLMVRLFMQLIKKSFNTEKSKFAAFLHLHDYHQVAKLIRFWSKITDIPKSKIKVYNKPSQHAFKKVGYRGCISVRYHDHKLAKEIFYLYTGFAKKYGGLV